MIDVWGDGKQTRSFMYVDDCVEGLQRLMCSDCPIPVNLDTGQMVTIDELVSVVARIAGKTVGFGTIDRCRRALVGVAAIARYRATSSTGSHEFHYPRAWHELTLGSPSNSCGVAPVSTRKPSRGRPYPQQGACGAVLPPPEQVVGSYGAGL